MFFFSRLQQTSITILCLHSRQFRVTPSELQLNHSTVIFKCEFRNNKTDTTQRSGDTGEEGMTNKIMAKVCGCGTWRHKQTKNDMWTNALESLIWCLGCAFFILSSLSYEIYSNRHFDFTLCSLMTDAIANITIAEPKYFAPAFTRAHTHTHVAFGILKLSNKWV